jgi:hypothetical protein
LLALDGDPTNPSTKGGAWDLLKTPEETRIRCNRAEFIPRPGHIFKFFGLINDEIDEIDGIGITI